MEKVPMTPEGHAALKEELTHLKSVERLKISKEIGVAREHGDLKENAEYHAAKEKQGLVEARIADIEDKIARAIGEVMLIVPLSRSDSSAPTMR